MAIFVKASCSFCGNAFIASRFRQRKRILESLPVFCSNSCQGQARRRRLSVSCEFCGKEFQGFPAYANNGREKYCSKSCKYRGMKRQSTIGRTCLFCSRFFLKRRCETKYKNGQYCSRVCWHRAMKSITGDKTSNWQGGKARLDRHWKGYAWKYQRLKVKKRDDYTCQECGKSELQLGTPCHVHHVIPFWNFTNSRKANSMKNLITLCNSCHMRTEHTIKEKQTLFLGKL